MSARPDRRLLYYRLGMYAGLGLVAAALVGAFLGSWRDSGVMLGIAGLAVTVWLGVGTASEQTVRRLEPPLDRISDDMATVRVVLERTGAGIERIERLLADRLPPRER